MHAKPSAFYPLIFTVLLTLVMGCQSADVEPIAQAPKFSLTNQHNHTFGSEQLNGQAYVAAFIFTRCPTICPTITKHMSDLALATPNQDLQFVSISVDPEHDTPAVLKAWSEQWPIPADKWHLLTGQQSQIDATSKGFIQGLEALPSAGEIPNIAHSERLILVDRTGRILALPHANTEGVKEIITLLSQATR